MHLAMQGRSLPADKRDTSSNLSYSDVYKRSSDNLTEDEDLFELHNSNLYSRRQQSKPRQKYIQRKSKRASSYKVDDGYGDDELDDVIDDDDLNTNNRRKLSILAPTHSSILNGGVTNIVAPSEDEEDFYISKESKFKPKSGNKVLSNPYTSTKDRKGSLTHEDLVRFMIRERQNMDEEQAALRQENELLKEKLVYAEATSPPTTNSTVSTAIMPAGRRYSDSVSSFSTVSADHEENMKKLIDQAEKLRLENLEMQEKLKKYEDFESKSRRMSAIIPSPSTSNDPSNSNDESSRKMQLKPPSDPPPFRVPSSLSNEVVNPLVIPRILWDGSQIWKIPYNGKGGAERRYLTIKKAPRSSDNTIPIQLEDDSPKSIPRFIFYPPTLVWFAGSGPGDVISPRELELLSDSKLISGRSTSAFEKYMMNQRDSRLDENLCFSIETSTRTLDIVVDSIEICSSWKRAFQRLLSHNKKKSEYIPSRMPSRRPSIDMQLNPASNMTNQPFIGGNYDTSRYTNHGYPSMNTHISPKYSNNFDSNRNFAERDFSRRLFQAAEIGDVMTLYEATRMGVNINTTYTLPTTPVSMASSSGNRYVAGDTALFIGCRYGHLNIVKACLNLGAKNDPHPEFGQTALHVAVTSAGASNRSGISLNPSRLILH